MFTIEYGLYEDQSREFTRECNSTEEVNTFLSVMEGLLAWYEVYDENGNELNNEWIVVSYNNLILPYPIPL